MWTVTRSVQPRPTSRGSDEIGIEFRQRWNDTKWRDTEQSALCRRYM